MPYAQAAVHIEDRGFQFADAVYEVCEVAGGRLVDETRHMQRLDRSLGELGIAQPMRRGAWSRVMRETVRRNRVRNGLVYLQVTRGARPRDFLFPPADVAPTVVCLARQSIPPAPRRRPPPGIDVKTMPENRWGRCDIKTVMLLPTALAKEAARKDGANEAWFVDADGYVTEGASSNAWIVDRRRPPGHPPDRQRHPARRHPHHADRPAEARGHRARRAALHRRGGQGGARGLHHLGDQFVMPVVRIDGKPIGNGAPGLLTLRLRAEFHSAAEIAGADSLHDLPTGNLRLAQAANLLVHSLT